MPYFKPYYDAQLAQHVERIRPYAETFYTKAYEPGSRQAQKLYAQYAAPHVSQLNGYGQAQWGKAVQPRLDDFKTQAAQQYNSALGPHVNKAYEAVDPYFKQTREAAVHQYQSNILPGYKKAVPYGLAAYEHGHLFVTTIALPYAHTASQVVYTFFARQVWPPLRVLYGENVQPQLVKIRERLSSYREGKRLESVMFEEDASIKAREPTESATAITDAISTAFESITSAAIPRATEPATRESLVEDLNSWKVKFTRAADRGAEDLKQRVIDITETQSAAQIDGTGRALQTQLEETARSSLAKLHKQINAIVDKLPDEVYEEDEKPAVEEAHAKIRTAGKHVKDAAQHLRSWKQMFVAETETLVKDATDSTLDVIDHIRDLGLQEIGMRWAGHDDTSYKDWSEYHSLKKTFDKWHGKIEDAAYSHKALKTVRQSAEDVESEGMALAEEAAKELVRLKDVALWKIRARDTSDDFDTRTIPAALIKAKEAVQEAATEASEAVFGTTQEPIESASSLAAETGAAITSSIASAASKARSVASEAVVDPVASVAGAASSGASESLESIAGGASSASSYVASASGSVASSASSLVDQINDEVAGASGMVAGKANDASSSISSAVNEAASSVSPSSQKPLSQRVVEAASGASASASKSVKQASKAAASAASSASSAAYSASQAAKDNAEDAAEALVESVASLSSRAQATIEGEAPATPGVSSLASEVSNSASKASKSASSAISSVSSKAKKSSSQASASIAPSASSAAGAANDHVSARIHQASASIASAASKAGSDYSSVTEKVVKAASSAAGEQ